MKPGDRMTWVHIPRGGYGYEFQVPCVIVRVGPKRATVDAQLARGGTKRVVVLLERLRPPVAEPSGSPAQDDAARKGAAETGENSGGGEEGAA